jgi:hypothetical protein
MENVPELAEMNLGEGLAALLADHEIGFDALILNLQRGAARPVLDLSRRSGINQSGQHGRLDAELLKELAETGLIEGIAALVKNAVAIF